MSFQESQVGQFVLAKTHYCHHDGWYEQVCKIIGNGEYPGFFTLQTESGTIYQVSEQDFIRYITQKPLINYYVGDTVEATVDYHWKDGDITDYCTVTDYKAWGDKLTYKLTNVKNPGTKYEVMPHGIKRKVTIKIPKFTIGSRISYDYCNGHPYFNDYETKNGIITHIIPWYDKVSYVINFDDGTVDTKEETLIKSYVPPAPKKDPYKNIHYLNQQEEMLLAQLEFIRSKKQEIA